mmetsp:Transcript_13018/g.22365  ORF Transcript_13018/g.22365 Transcript_13018/m.22365 type:complete len:159 (-) Transcript_13018:298-774(-)
MIPFLTSKFVKWYLSQHEEAGWQLLNTVAYSESVCVRHIYDDSVYNLVVYFGYTIAMDENYLVVGAPRAPGNGRRSGQVNVYRCNHGVDCLLIQTLLPTLELLPVGTLEEVTEAPEATEVPDDGQGWYQDREVMVFESTEEPTERPLPEDHANSTEDD